MIARLRFKLIVAAMVSLSAVLLVVVGAIGIVNYRKLVSDADNTLNFLADNGGFFPNMQQVERPQGNQGLFPDREPAIHPELPFETRYFFAVLDEAGQVVSVNTGRIAAIDEEDAAAYAQNVWAGGASQGFVDDYRFLTAPVAEGTMILFLDCGRSLDSFHTLLISSVAISVTGALLVLLLLVLLSGRMVKPFAEAYAKQKRFITDAGHELKTPLTIIDADTEILSMDFGENEWLGDIRAQTRRLFELTSDLILLSRMEEEQSAAVQLLDFPLSDVVEETIQSFQNVAKAQGKSFMVDIEPMISFCGDEKSIRKLITVLLDNALKYTPSGGEIRCALKRQKSSVQFWVYNTAETITKEQIPYLFDRFYRTDASRNSETGGYGLGLSIAQAIVLAHKGKIGATTEDEHSLTITVSLPV